ncbi:type IV toxin-antitoxin system AbiEi family antitoxin domain-containing protein [Sinomonas sp. ASV322]|uniref:type IV toxin-antitoxin system AbiEi family antitoxin domain-containing protein n=1 Tax=Sinomonas sp. ASV322 TaxID=3041920 RepID=UPI0027DCBF35|nr:type IV toxin-antitoxin system AbiEi family antitoxin domain-containing protein [Sinomonas sp. ASV322]MDQ4501853.1 type IV toxin-antitoxin system AbiEi family antitoxin domain-containing protein [Sinomonas sp. ASV322]
MESVTALLRDRGGIARTRQLLEAGARERDLARAVAAGLVDRVRPGIYSVPEADPVLVRCVATNSRLTCLSAAEHYGLWMLRKPDKVHVLRPDGAFASERAVVHRRSWVPGEPAAWIASKADVLLHALGCLPELEALVLVESASRQGFSLDFLRDRLPGRRNAAARRVLDLVDVGSESLLETLARTHLRRAGFHVQPQVDVRGVGSMDLLVESCVDVETDGKEHEAPSRRFKDYRRDNVAQSLGFAVARFVYADIVHRPEDFVRQVTAVVETRLALGGLPRLDEL